MATSQLSRLVRVSDGRLEVGLAAALWCRMSWAHIGMIMTGHAALPDVASACDGRLRGLADVHGEGQLPRLPVQAVG